ncbi:MAG: SCO family protein [Rhizobacter sp.]|nr:SCO family protein [Rhizobacter sp.]
MADRTRRLILQLIGACAAAGSGWLAGCDKTAVPGAAAPPAQFKGIDITGANYALELSLPDTEGRRRSLADFKGRAVVVFFGFTQCPDVCPATLLELAEVKKALGADGARVQGVFVTVDPERDTPEVLKAYVGNFGSDFVALRGTLDETKAVAKHFKVYFNKVPGATPSTYSVDHTAGSFVFDGQGRVRLFTRYGTGTAPLVHDLKLLLAET